VSLDLLLTQFKRVSDSPDSILRLRRFVLDLAVHGKLVDQDAGDSSAELLIEQVSIAQLETPLSPKYRSIVDCPIMASPFDLPRLWAWTRLGRVADYIQRGKSPKYSASTGPPVVSQKCVRWEGLDLGPAKSLVPESLDAYEPQRFLRDGDLLWNSTGTGTIGRISRVIAPPARLVCDSHITVVRCSQVDPEYIRCWLRSDHVYGRIEGDASGSTNQVELTLQMALSQAVPLPPLAEQHRIVAKVDELMGLCDHLEAAQKERELKRDSLRSVSLHRLTAVHSELADVRFFLDRSSRLITKPEHVAAVRQTILDLAVRGRLVPQDPADEPAVSLLKHFDLEKAEAGGRNRHHKHTDRQDEVVDLPSQWVLAHLSQMAQSIDYGTSQRASLVPAGIPVLRMGNIVKGKLSFAHLKYIRRDLIADDLLLSAGDLLFNRTNSAELVGKNAIFEGSEQPMTFASYLIRVRPLNSANMRWANIALMSSDGMIRLASVKSQQTGQANINGTKLADTPIPLPPLAEQHRIIAKVDKLMVLCDEMETAMASAQKARGQLLESLLREALKGSGDRAVVGDFAGVV
jgi:type I restriction enzyme S subunit